MSFAGTGIHILQLIGFFATSITNIFNGLDNTQFWDSPFSLLDIYIAIILLELIFWYILRLIKGKEGEAKGSMYDIESSAGYEYGESSVSSANADQIDFSEEILHE